MQSKSGFGETLKKTRKRLGLTQKQLGKTMKISVQTVSAYESGRRKPKVETIKRFASALGISASDLLNDEGARKIDFDAWKPCELCKRLGEADPCYKDGCFRKNAPQCDYRCDKFLGWRAVQRRLNKAKFCPECGRPLTSAARELLERRLEK